MHGTSFEEHPWACFISITIIQGLNLTQNPQKKAKKTHKNPAKTFNCKLNVFSAQKRPCLRDKLSQCCIKQSQGLFSEISTAPEEGHCLEEMYWASNEIFY